MVSQIQSKATPDTSSYIFLTLFNFTKFERLEVEAVLPSATLGLILQRTSSRWSSSSMLSCYGL